MKNLVSRLSILGAVVIALATGACGGGGEATPSPTAVPTAAACGAVTPVQGVPALVARRVTGGLLQPLDLQSSVGDAERLYVVEQGGRIRVLRNGQLAASPFLEIADRISTGGERGLLGLALHPRFASNRRLFVNYTNRSGDTHISEFRAGSADSADAGSERVLLVVPQPFSNHNGGGLAFGSDGRLYIGLGDGGSGGDPQGNGQRLDTLLGKMLRIDVDGAQPYAVPADNPFRATAGARPEIWAYGLRNPFRFSFDRTTGDLYIGDVGQNRVEEIDVGVVSHRGGENYGWNSTEGSQCYSPASGCDRSGVVFPIYEYGHNEGCSVTGGVVYRGCRIPALAGTYFFGDFCTGFVRSLRLVDGKATDVRTWTSLEDIGQISAFGADADGEILVVDYGGEIYRLEPAS